MFLEVWKRRQYKLTYKWGSDEEMDTSDNCLSSYREVAGDNHKEGLNTWFPVWKTSNKALKYSTIQRNWSTNFMWKLEEDELAGVQV